MFRYPEHVFDLDPEIADRARSSCGRAQLHGLQVSGAPIDQGQLGAPRRVGAVDARIETDACDPLGARRPYWRTVVGWPIPRRLALLFSFGAVWRVMAV